MSSKPRLSISARSAAMRLVEGLADGGVAAAVGLDDPRAYFAALRKSRIATAIVHDERAGGFMADGYARVAGRPVACSGISGPGAVNLAPPLLEALTSCVPLVAVVGEFSAPRHGLRAFQEVTHASFLGSGVTKAVVEIRDLRHSYAGARRAAEIATSGRPGPVLLVISDHLLWQEVAEEDDHGEPPEIATEPPTDEAIRAACRALATAACPAVVAGAGVHCAGAHDELLELARRYGLPVATSMSGKGAIDETDALALGVTGAYTSGVDGRGRPALDCLKAADVILVVGSDLDMLTTNELSWPGDGTLVIRIDIDPAEMAGISGLQLLGDARAVLARMLTVEHEPSMPAARQEHLDHWASEVRLATARISQADLARETSGSVWPGAVMQEIDAQMGRDDYVVADASYSSSWTLDRIRQQRSGRQVLAPRGVGTLGWGVPAAMGAQMAAPEAKVTAVVGDGALFYALPEMETATRLGLGVTTILLRNGVYGSQRQSNMLAQQQDYPDLRFGEHIDHAALARSLGWRVAHVTSQDELRAAYAEAQASDDPWLLDVAVDPDARPALSKFDVS
jgi:acetolactate synthase I/II/III large subunit